MKKQLFILSMAALSLTACDGKSNHPKADNTERNANDTKNYTAGDQSESAADRTISQNIRRLLMDDNTLSTTAKNIKIITINGSVTLRGPVNTEAERTQIAAKARQVSGVKGVDNQIEIISTNTK